MKTAKHTTAVPRVKKIAIISTSVVVFCLLSILVPKAHDNNTMYPNVGKDFLRLLNEEEPEAILELQDWMLDFRDENAANVIKAPLNVHIVSPN